MVEICIGSDHGGFELKEKISSYLRAQAFAFQDIGTHSNDSVDYPTYALQVAHAVASGEAQRGILVCGTGLGMSIAANRVPGIRAVVVSDVFTAHLSREHNDSNVLCLGGRIIGPDLAIAIVREWIDTKFAGGRHTRRIEMFDKGVAQWSE
jgi:ribose 5-phosphate isomerase B